MKKRVLAIMMAVAMVATCLTGCVKVVEKGHEGDLTGEVAFDAGSNVEEMWEASILPECEGKAVELAELLNKAGDNLKGLGEEFGGYKAESATNYNYCVKAADCTIAAVDKESFYGTITLTVPGYEGKVVVNCEIGKYKSSAIRDDMSFINFASFKNQTEWNQIKKSIQQKADEAVVQPVYDQLTEGTKLDIMACFAADKNDVVTLSPVSITIK